LPRDGLSIIPLSARKKFEAEDTFGGATAGGCRTDEKESKADIQTGRFGQLLQVKYHVFCKPMAGSAFDTTGASLFKKRDKLPTKIRKSGWAIYGNCAKSRNA